jgi:hypothetical protein
MFEQAILTDVGEAVTALGAIPILHISAHGYDDGSH